MVRTAVVFPAPLGPSSTVTEPDGCGSGNPPGRDRERLRDNPCPKKPGERNFAGLQTKVLNKDYSARAVSSPSRMLLLYKGLFDGLGGEFLHKTGYDYYKFGYFDLILRSAPDASDGMSAARRTEAKTHSAGGPRPETASCSLPQGLFDGQHPALGAREAATVHAVLFLSHFHEGTAPLVIARSADLQRKFLFWLFHFISPPNVP
jgi:hypothetical protein